MFGLKIRIVLADKATILWAMGLKILTKVE
jgi:hypothetical protein